MREHDISELAKRLEMSFNDPDILRQAMVHRSFLNENPSFRLGHNERLEFLGDAVLELAVTDFLYEQFPKEDEGTLTAYRSALVNAVTISETAIAAGLNGYLMLSKGEAKDKGRARQIILANAYEAVVGAIYLDQGYQAAARFISKTLLPMVNDIVANNRWLDAKSYFQEKAQDIDGLTPAYQVLSETGPDHDKKFTVGVYVGDNLIAKGSGHSKQEAEQDAARKGLVKRKWNIAR